MGLTSCPVIIHVRDIPQLCLDEQLHLEGSSWLTAGWPLEIQFESHWKHYSGSIVPGPGDDGYVGDDAKLP